MVQEGCPTLKVLNMGRGSLKMHAGDNTVGPCIKWYNYGMRDYLYVTSRRCALIREGTCAR